MILLPPFLVLSSLLPNAPGAPVLPPAQEDPGPAPAVRPVHPPSRALSRSLTAIPRLAGTAGSRPAARLVAETLERAGFTVEVDAREVLLSYPERIHLVASDADGQPLFEREDRFDPDAWPAEDIPLFNGWSASGVVEGEVVDVGHGLRLDFELALASGVDPEGKIALARYGRAYRGVKAELAEEYGFAGALLFNDPAVDGDERGTPWPEGPWKPAWDAERGSISSIARAPGDATTPGWPSPAPGVAGRRLSVEEAAEHLPKIPCVPIGSAHARALLGSPGARVRMDVVAPRTLRTVHNVLGRLEGSGDELVVAGNHRDAWVRGAHDAASGTTSLLRAAQILGEAVRNGWQPRSSIVLGFWDAEEYGLIGSTEWAEAHAAELRSHGRLYVNADAVVSGLRVSLSGSPGLEPLAERALAAVPAPGNTDATLLDQWRATRRIGDDDAWTLGLVGSGSDYTVFLHHLGLPVLDVSFGGNRAGQYHTSFDDFELMDRTLDPTWQGHETAGAFLAQVLTTFADADDPFDDARAARAMAETARRLGAEEESGEAWFGEARAELLAAAFERLAEAVDGAAGAQGPSLLMALQRGEGLAGRTWYRNALWAPGLETGYASETFPTLRTAAREGDDALYSALEQLVVEVDQLTAIWRAQSGSGYGSSEAGDDRRP